MYPFNLAHQPFDRVGQENAFWAAGELFADHGVKFDIAQNPMMFKMKEKCPTLQLRLEKHVVAFSVYGMRKSRCHSFCPTNFATLPPEKLCCHLAVRARQLPLFTDSDHVT